jgi:hypothetical protein
LYLLADCLKGRIVAVDVADQENFHRVQDAVRSRLRDLL